MGTEHNCRLVGKLGELLYVCSRCGRCYVCHHEAVWVNDQWIWKAKLRGGKIKFESVINDGRLSGFLEATP
jgi:hypothetical protein